MAVRPVKAEGLFGALVETVAVTLLLEVAIQPVVVFLAVAK